MPRSLDLPDGTTITGIGDEKTTEEITTFLLNKGYEVPSDLEGSLYTPSSKTSNTDMPEGSTALEEDPNTWADWVNTAFEIGPAMAAGSLGVKTGAEVGSRIASAVPYPPAKAVIVGGSALAGGIAATAPLVFAGKYSGEFAEALIEGRTFDPTAATNSAIDAAQTDAMATALFGSVGPVASTLYKFGKQKFGGKFTLDDKQIDQVIELQKKLKEYGSSLLPQMIKPKAWGARFTTDLAAVSELTKDTVDSYMEGYETYMGAQISKLIGDYGNAPASAMGQGEVLQTLLTQTREALDEIVSPMYRVITETGKKVTVNARQQGQLAADGIRQLRRGEKVGADGKIINTTNFFSPAEGQAVKYLEELPENLNFWEAHQRLSHVKQQLHDVTSGATKDKHAGDAWGAARDVLQKAMDDAAEKLDPALKAKYKEVNSFYREGSEVVNREYFKKALAVNEPSQIGAMLTQPGFQVGLNDIRELRKLAVEYGRKLPEGSSLAKTFNEKDPLEAIRRGYLEAALKMAPEAGENSLQAFRRNMSTPKFRDTFDNLFAGTATRGKIDELLEELTIFERVTGSTGGAFALTVRSGELSPVRNPTVSGLIKGILPGLLARKAIDVKSIDETISLMRAAAEFKKRGMELPKETQKRLVDMVTKYQRIGLGVVGGLTEERTVTPVSNQPQPQPQQQGMLTGVGV